VFELDDLVFYSELLALEVAEDFVVGQGSMDFLIDGLLQAAVTGPEGLDTILQRHETSYPLRNEGLPTLMLTPWANGTNKDMLTLRAKFQGDYSPRRWWR
jgi:hypothetical protein